MLLLCYSNCVAATECVSRTAPPHLVWEDPCFERHTHGLQGPLAATSVWFGPTPVAQVAQVA